MTSNFRSPSFWDRRPGESEYAHAARIRPYLAHREDAQADAAAAHAEFRQRQEARIQGTGYGLAGDATPAERAQALGSRGFGSGRQIEHRGGQYTTAVPGSVAIGHVYADQLTDGDPGQQVSPLAAWARANSGEQWS
jgi:hypothetical protein